MLGQPYYMPIPDIIGFRLNGELEEGVTATDLVLTVTQILRKHGVVGKFVEFFGPGVSKLSLPDRATISNMSPEYGATCGFFPIDDQTLNYLLLSGRGEDHVSFIREYTKRQGLYFNAKGSPPKYTEVLNLDLRTVEPSLAGPKRPQDRIPLILMQKSFHKSLSTNFGKTAHMHGDFEDPEQTRWREEGGSTNVDEYYTHDANFQRFFDAKKGNDSCDPVDQCDLSHGSVVIAAITSCTNTSNPSVLIGAGLMAKKAVELGLKVLPSVKTSLAPGSRVVTEYLQKSGLLLFLEQLGFSIVGYGCTTCIGNSGPLDGQIIKEIKDKDLVAVAVLSGNRNFEGRINPFTKANYLMSPMLVVAYALAGTIDINFTKEPLGNDEAENPVYLKDIWPSRQEIATTVSSSVNKEMFEDQYAQIFEGTELWNHLEVPKGRIYDWDSESTYIREPPFFIDFPIKPLKIKDIENAYVLVLVGDSITTDHISPAGAIPKEDPAGKYLVSEGIKPKGFNSYGSRRGNHEVMMRGTFGNIRLRNQLAPEKEGGWTQYIPTKEIMSIFSAAKKYRTQKIPLLVIAGKEYGTGSSRDWAAKGPQLLGIKAVLAESYERIHRSNLVGMGVLPLQFQEGENPRILGLTGEEVYDIRGLEKLTPNAIITVTAKKPEGSKIQFQALSRLDSEIELQYYRNGGILHTVLRNLLSN
jgi:aconitate hydratase